MSKEIEKIIKQAHDAITRIKGKDYAPTSREIQEYIDKLNPNKQ